MSLGNKTLVTLGSLLQDDFRQELRDQGHYLTGALEKSVQPEFLNDPAGWTLEMFAEDYNRYVNDGFPAKSANWKQFPFLVEYFEKRGYSETEAKRRAGMTINSWMKHGMPSPGSYAYSNNGSRTESIERTYSAGENNYSKTIEAGISDEIDEALDQDFNVKII